MFFLVGKLSCLGIIGTQSHGSPPGSSTLEFCRIRAVFTGYKSWESKGVAPQIQMPPPARNKA